MLHGGVHCLGGLHPGVEDLLCAFPVLEFKLIACCGVEGADGVGKFVPDGLHVVIVFRAACHTVQLEPFLALGLGELAIRVKVSLVEGALVLFLHTGGHQLVHDGIAFLRSLRTWEGLEKHAEEGVERLQLVLGEGFETLVREELVVVSGAASAAATACLAS